MQGEGEAALTPRLAAFLGVVLCAALGISAFGIISAVTDSDAVGTSGLPPAVGAVGFALALAVFLFVVGGALRAVPPSYLTAVLSAPAVVGGYAIGIASVVVFDGQGLGVALGVAGSFLLSWFAVALALSAAISGWLAIASIRTRVRGAQWPWEKREEEDS